MPSDAGFVALAPHDAAIRTVKDYAAAGTPSFSGEMGPLKSPDLDFGGLLSSPMATCTWSAKLR